jgi:hypothetical protein
MCLLFRPHELPTIEGTKLEDVPVIGVMIKSLFDGFGISRKNYDYFGQYYSLNPTHKKREGGLDILFKVSGSKNVETLFDTWPSLISYFPVLFIDHSSVQSVEALLRIIAKHPDLKYEKVSDPFIDTMLQPYSLFTF